MRSLRTEAGGRHMVRRTRLFLRDTHSFCKEGSYKSGCFPFREITSPFHAHTIHDLRNSLRPRHLETRLFSRLHSQPSMHLYLAGLYWDRYITVQAEAAFPRVSTRQSPQTDPSREVFNAVCGSISCFYSPRHDASRLVLR